MPITNAERIWKLLTDPAPALRYQFNENPAVPSVAGIGPDAEPILFFSDFVEEHLHRARLIRREMQAFLNGTGSDEAKLGKVLDYYESLLGKENPDLLRYALLSFLATYKGTERFMTPSLLVREPERATPSNVPGHIRIAIAIGDTNETRLDWFREAPCINEHHAHWHMVYNGDGGIDRQGEMFLYMHQQMLARYDIERIAEGVARVNAFTDFRKTISVGYGSGPDERIAMGGFSGYRDRSPLEKVGTADAAKQVTLLTQANNDIANNYYDTSATTMQSEIKTVNKLGSTLEPNNHPDTDRTRVYRGYHGDGHMSIHKINKGVMGSTVFAVRDVVFWEWHKGIDDLYFNLQQKFKPYKFDTDAPPVLLRKSTDDEDRLYSMDIILVTGDNLLNDEEGKRIGKLAFGGTNWDKDFEAGGYSYTDAGINRTITTTRTLSTATKKGTIRYRLPGETSVKQYPYDYLVHTPFSYFIRLENTSLERKRVTVRIFMVPAGYEEDRRMWIEMDKFLYDIDGLSKEVLYRRDIHSSVVAKPAVIDPSTHHTTFNPVNLPQSNECDCGWPYQMLLPKGKKGNQGMEFRLMIVITDGELDEVAGDRDCGSLSFCAARSDSYPDRRPLGYPFNRPFDQNGILNTIRSLDNMACRTVFIKHS
ncbi:MAG: tyrosinase family protein [Chitinophagaceae bacterium]|nr:tyrosinase family protein [Chitinophagaceae bacterium]